MCNRAATSRNSLDKNMNTSARILASLAVALAALTPAAARAQGSLVPPGAPAPTMKTLQQIEPRIDLQSAPASAVTTTNAAYHFIINQPGSYYLSANLDVTKSNGIQINAEGVTLDLNGFEISRASGSGGNGIEIPAAGHRASVRNGSLKGFTYGIRSLVLVSDFGRGCSFRDLSVSSCTVIGILAGESAVLDGCRAHDNSGTYGIFAGPGSSLSNCTASHNTGSAGISADIGSSLTNCAASNNPAFTGIFANGGSSLINCTAKNNTGTYGIDVESFSSLTNCSASNNTSVDATSAGISTGANCTISNCSSSSNSSTAAASASTTGMGFDVGGSSTIHGCTANSNEGDGINLLSDSVARGNMCDSNGNGGDGAGIHATSSDNRIEGNNVTDNDRGIDVDAAGNLIIKNSASGNAANWDVVSGNVILVVQASTAAAVSGNSGGTPPGSTDPNANFTY